MKRLISTALCAAILGTGVMASAAEAQEAPEVTATKEFVESQLESPRRIRILDELQRSVAVKKDPQISVGLEPKYKSRFIRAMEDELLHELGKVDEDSFILSGYRFEMNHATSLHALDGTYKRSVSERFGRDAARIITKSAGPDAGLAALPAIDLFLTNVEQRKDEWREENATMKRDRWSFGPDLEIGDGFIFLEGSYEYRDGFKLESRLSAKEFEIGLPLGVTDGFANRLDNRYQDTPVLRHLPDVVRNPVYFKITHEWDTGSPSAFLGYRAVFGR